MDGKFRLKLCDIFKLSIQSSLAFVKITILLISMDSKTTFNYKNI